MSDDDQDEESMIDRYVNTHDELLKSNLLDHMLIFCELRYEKNIDKLLYSLYELPIVRIWSGCKLSNIEFLLNQPNLRLCLVCNDINIKYLSYNSVFMHIHHNYEQYRYECPIDRIYEMTEKLSVLRKYGIEDYAFPLKSIEIDDAVEINESVIPYILLNSTIPDIVIRKCLQEYNHELLTKIITAMKLPCINCHSLKDMFIGKYSDVMQQVNTIWTEEDIEIIKKYNFLYLPSYCVCSELNFAPLTKVNIAMMEIHEDIIDVIKEQLQQYPDIEFNIKYINLENCIL